jgi:hypothetical protein
MSKCSVRNIENIMADWKVIETVSGNIEAVSGPAAQDRPGTHEWIVWERPAADKAEALKCAEKADPRVDLEWMRVRPRGILIAAEISLIRLKSVASLPPSVKTLLMRQQYPKTHTSSKRCAYCFSNF